MPARPGGQGSPVEKGPPHRSGAKIEGELKAIHRSTSGKYEMNMKHFDSISSFGPWKEKELVVRYAIDL
jgi:hypothetical protein